MSYVILIFLRKTILIDGSSRGLCPFPDPSRNENWPIYSENILLPFSMDVLWTHFLNNHSFYLFLILLPLLSYVLLWTLLSTKTFVYALTKMNTFQRNYSDTCPNISCCHFSFHSLFMLFLPNYVDLSSCHIYPNKWSSKAVGRGPALAGRSLFPLEGRSLRLSEWP